MNHLFWVVPGRLAGRPGPDRVPWKLGELRGAGIGAVLSVNDGLLCHPADFRRIDMAYECIPLSGNAPPQPGDIEHCLEALPRALDFVERQLAEGRTTLVHCSSGKDRTGLLFAYYWMRNGGAEPDEAIERVRQVRPIAFSATGWDELALEVLRAIQSK